MLHLSVSPACCYFCIASAYDLLLFAETLSFCDLVQTDADLETAVHKLSYTLTHLTSLPFSALLLLWHTPDLSTLLLDLQKNVETFPR